jgi:hypothetical protein
VHEGLALVEDHELGALEVRVQHVGLGAHKGEAVERGRAGVEAGISGVGGQPT